MRVYVGFIFLFKLTKSFEPLMCGCQPHAMPFHVLWLRSSQFSSLDFVQVFDLWPSIALSDFYASPSHPLPGVAAALVVVRHLLSSDHKSGRWTIYLSHSALLTLRVFFSLSFSFCFKLSRSFSIYLILDLTLFPSLSSIFVSMFEFVCVCTFGCVWE